MIDDKAFGQWLIANIEKVPMIQWGENHSKIAVLFANDMIQPYRQLIADIVNHIDAQDNNRYASTKDEHDVVDQLNNRIMELLNANLQSDIDPDVPDETGSTASEREIGPGG